MEVIGDILGDDGKPLVEELEIYRRDPVECIKELLGNPAFKKKMKFAPQQVYQDEAGNVWAFGETWSGEWWWNLQVFLFYVCILPRIKADLPLEITPKRRHNCACYPLHR